MDVRELNSVVFETTDLPRLREFYVTQLGLPVGTFEKDGVTVSDENETYFNLNINGTLLGFEAGEAQLGTVVFKVGDLGAARERIHKLKLPIVREKDFFTMIHDPDGREIILEAV